MRFADIPNRGYSQTDPSWWNSLRSAGIFLDNLFGYGAISETAFSFANNQGTPTNVTGLLFSSAGVKSAWCWISARRTNGTNVIFTEVELWLSYDSVNAVWILQDQVEHGAPSGLTFSITSGGQVQYTSSNLTNIGGGSYADTSKFKAMATGV